MRTIMFPLEDCGKATIKMEETQIGHEPLLRVNITQNTKGFQWEITCRADTVEEIKSRLDKLVAIAVQKCKDLNAGVLVS